MPKFQQKKQIPDSEFMQIYKFYDLRKIVSYFPEVICFYIKKARGADDERSKNIIIFICINNTIMLFGL